MLVLNSRLYARVLQDSEVSVSYHETELGNLPFLFVGGAAQQYADCKEIVYPDFRTTLGWMCKHRVNKRASAASSAFRLHIPPPAIVLPAVAAVAAMLL